NLAYFDAHQISWVLSSFRPGKMLTEYRYYNWSKLDDGWTCGEDPSRGGIAMILAAHLWSGDPHGLFVVNHVNGGMVLARGGLATAYGPILAEREVSGAPGQPLPLRLGNVSVRGQRSDVSSSSAPVIIADVARGFLTVSSDARGAVAGEVVQRWADSGETKRFATAECGSGGCRTVPIPLSGGVITTVRVAGSGIRNAGPDAAIRVTGGGIAGPVLS